MESRGERRRTQTAEDKGSVAASTQEVGGGGMDGGFEGGEGEKRGDVFALGDERKVLRSRH